MDKFQTKAVHQLSLVNAANKRIRLGNETFDFWLWKTDIRLFGLIKTFLSS